MNPQAKRNKYRGLQGFIKHTYKWRDAETENIWEDLQTVEQFKGVSKNSVSACLTALRRDNPKGKPRMFNGLRGKALDSDMLITIPLPKKQSATLTLSEARALHRTLGQLFGA